MYNVSQKPFKGTRLISGHPLRPDVLAILFNDGGPPSVLGDTRFQGISFTDYVSGRAIHTSSPSAGSTRNFVVTKRGIGWQHTVSGDQIACGFSGYLPTDEMTILGVYNNVSGSNSIMCNVDGSGAAGTLCRVLDFNGSRFWDFAGTTAGTSRISVAYTPTNLDDVWVYNAGPRGMEMYKNGVRVASQAGHALRTNDNSKQFFIGGDGVSGSTSSIFHAIYIYSKQLSPENCIWLSYDPWAPFYIPVYNRKHYYFAAAAAASTNQAAVLNMPQFF